MATLAQSAFGVYLLRCNRFSQTAVAAVSFQNTKMPMTKYIFFLLTITQINCTNNVASGNRTSSKIDSSSLMYKKGDCLAFKLDSSTYGAGIIFDSSKDEGGLWYCLLFTDYVSPSKPAIDSIKNHKVFGRKVESSLAPQGYEVMIDGEFLNDSMVSKGNNFILLGNISLNDKAKLGAYGATSKISGLIQAFKNGQSRRTSPPDNYHDQIKKLNTFRPEEYFNVKDFLK